MKIRFPAQGVSVELEPAETALEALERLGCKVPRACLNGVCHVCRARCLSGDPDAEPYVLLCKFRPTTDCELDMPNLYPPGVIAPREMALQIAAVTELTADVHRVELLAPAGRLPEYHAGQYLELLIPEVSGAFFSIANAPGTRQLELHVQASSDSSSARAILSWLRTQPTVRARLPMGACCLSAQALPTGPVVLVAAGTGFAQIKSILEGLQARHFAHPIHVFWGVRQSKEFYLLPLLEAWRHQPGLQVTAISADTPSNAWSGHHDELIKALQQAAIDWPLAEVYASGSPGMVYAVLDTLLERGLAEARFHSDVLQYAPR